MTEPFMYFGGRFWPVVAVFFVGIWYLCFVRRRNPWILPLWALFTFPPALITYRCLGAFAIDTRGPDGGWVAMGAGFMLLALLPNVVAFAILLIAVPRKPAWNLTGITTSLAIVGAEILLFNHWAAHPPTGDKVIFEVRQLDGTPIPNAVFVDFGNTDPLNKRPRRQFTADADGIIEAHTDANGKLSGSFSVPGMDEQSIRFLRVGSGVPGKNPTMVEHYWVFRFAVQNGLYSQQYSITLPETNEIRRTIYVRPAGSFATLPYWKELMAPDGLLSSDPAGFKSVSATHSLTGIELLEPCKALLRLRTEPERRLALGIVEAMILRIREFSEECQIVAKDAAKKGTRAGERQEIARAMRAILESAQIPVSADDDLEALVSKVMQMNADRLKLWETLQPPAPSFGAPPAWQRGD